MKMQVMNKDGISYGEEHADEEKRNSISAIVQRKD
jgi:hypothetical protein